MTAPLSHVRSRSYPFAVILNAVKHLLLLFPSRCSLIARPSSDESLFGVQNRPASAIVSSLPFLFVVILNAVKDLSSPLRVPDPSVSRVGLAVASSPGLPRLFQQGSPLAKYLIPPPHRRFFSPFVVIPTERSDEGSLFASRNRQNRPAFSIVLSLSSLFAVILNAVKDLLLLFPSRCFPASSIRPNPRAVVALGAVSPFFASRILLRATT